MSKNYILKVGDYLFEQFSKPIREKEDVLVLLLESIKILLLGNVINEENAKGDLILKVDKMSRLFFFTEKKMFSFNFPFTIEENSEDNLIARIYDPQTGIELDSKMISLMLALVNQKIFDGDSIDGVFVELSETIISYGGTDEINTIWLLIKKLMVFECGYLRYDYDSEHENGKKHPLFHCDINFSSNVTFKVGLLEAIKIHEFIDILDINTDCHFLSKQI